MLVVDIETSGRYPDKNSILSIGAINFNDPEDRFLGECKIWEGAEVEEEALKINGFSYEEATDPNKKTEGELMKEFKEWLRDKEDITVAGQNCFFDVYFLNAAFVRAGEKEVIPKRIVEQHSITIYHMLKRGITPPVKDHQSGLNSDSVMEYVGIPSEPKPHIAINGAIWEFEALHRLIKDTPGLEEFKKYPIPWLSS